MGKKLLAGLLAALVLFWPFLSLLTPARLRDYVYRTYCYQVIADQAAGDAAQPRLIAERMLDFIYSNNFVAYSVVPVDATPLNDLLIGMARCDQRSNILAQLLSFKGIDAALIWLRGKTSYSAHTVTRVYLDQGWRIMDPLYGVIFQDDQGNIAEFEDIQNKDPEFSSRIKGDFSTHWFLDKYSAFFEKRNPPSFWTPPGKKVEGTRKYIRQLVTFYYRLFGKTYFNLYQDAYLAAARVPVHETFDLRKPAEALYFSGRCYQLCARFEKAFDSYMKLVREYPDYAHADKVEFFAFSVLMKQGEWERAQSGLEEFINRPIHSYWTAPAQIYLDWCNYHLGRDSLPEAAADVGKTAFYFR